MPSIELSGTIDPATESWIDSALDDAADDGAPLAIIRIDTPGGLESSMREIIEDIIDAPMPVVVYVSPDGARAASAGAFITEAADVAAMAPQTNIGSASAVTSTGEDIGGTLGRKIENDAAAFIRALAESHGRNGDLAGTMVTEAANVTADEALDADAIDLIAADEDELLAALDGFEVAGPEGADARDRRARSSTSATCRSTYELLQLLVNPTIAYLLLLVGFVGIAIEFFSPGRDHPRARRRRLAPARRLRHRAAAGHRGRDRAAGPRRGPDRGRDPDCRPTGSSASSASPRSRSRACCSSTPAPTRSRSRSRW